MAVAPAAAVWPAVIGFSPPSTSMIGCSPRSAHIARRRRILGNISGRKPWPPNPRIHCHHENDVAEMQNIVDEFRRRRRV